MTKKELNFPTLLIVRTMYLLLEKQNQSKVKSGFKWLDRRQLSEFDKLDYSLGNYRDDFNELVRTLKFDFYGRDDPVELSKEYVKQKNAFDISWNENEETGTPIDKKNAARRYNTIIRNALKVNYEAIIKVRGKYKLAYALRPENIDLELFFSHKSIDTKKVAESKDKQPILLLEPHKFTVSPPGFIPSESQLIIFKNFENKHGFISRSKEILNVFDLVQSCGDEIEVLITGESGVGKELIAKAIHNESNRKNKPFVAENIAGPIELLNNLLFGSEKGSYTSSIRLQIGIFEQADKGTVFLDEIGDMNLEMQARLLRVLQNNSIKRTGGTKEIEVNYRLICATNKNLEKEIELGRFREDLYYRINAFPIEIPPLRKRINDIPYLANYFFNKFFKKGSSASNQSEIKWISPNDFYPLMTFDWKGNVRQLENFIHRFVTINKNELSKLKPGMLRKIFEDGIINIKEILLSETTQDKIFRDNKYIEILIAYVKNRCNILHTSKNLGIDRDTVRAQLRSSLVQLGSNFDFNENKMVTYLIDSNYISEDKKSMLTGNIIDVFKKIIKIYKDKDAKQYFHKPDEPLVIQLSIIRSDLA